MAATECTMCAGKLRPWGAGGTFARCKNCGFVVRESLPSHDDLARMYEASWETPADCEAETGDTDLGLARQYVDALAGSIGVKRLDGLEILDYGAGKGAMSTALMQTGASVWAYEPFGHQYLRDQGYRVVRDVEELPQRFSFDGIVAMQVLEHLSRPEESVARLRGLLKPGGWLLIATPNPNGLNARLRRDRWREARKAGHLMFFTPASLELLLARSGYAERCRLVWNVRYQGGWSSWIKDFCLRSAGLDGDLRYLAR